MIQDNPDVVKAFVAAASKGYEYAIENPSEAADILIEAAPDLDKALVHKSQGGWPINTRTMPSNGRAKAFCVGKLREMDVKQSSTRGRI